MIIENHRHSCRAHESLDWIEYALTLPKVRSLPLRPWTSLVSKVNEEASDYFGQ